jgi:hypothetical protein
MMLFDDNEEEAFNKRTKDMKAESVHSHDNEAQPSLVHNAPAMEDPQRPTKRRKLTSLMTLPEEREVLNQKARTKERNMNTQTPQDMSSLDRTSSADSFQALSLNSSQFGQDEQIASNQRVIESKKSDFRGA